MPQQFIKQVLKGALSVAFPAAPGWQTEATKEREQSITEAGLIQDFIKKV